RRYLFSRSQPSAYLSEKSARSGHQRGCRPVPGRLLGKRILPNPGVPRYPRALPPIVLRTKGRGFNQNDLTEPDPPAGGFHRLRTDTDPEQMPAPARDKQGIYHRIHTGSAAAESKSAAVYRSGLSVHDRQLPGSDFAETGSRGGLYERI